MPRGQWADQTPGKRSAAAKKAAAARNRQAKRRKAMPSEREQLRAYLHDGGAPLAAPERGAAEDRVLQGEQLSELLARIRVRYAGDRAA